VNTVQASQGKSRNKTRETSPSLAGEVHVSISEAAKMLAKGQTFIRSLITKGDVDAIRTELGHWSISSDSLRSYAATHMVARDPTSVSRRVAGASRGRVDAARDPEIDLTRELRAALAREQEAVERERRLSDELRARVRELELERTQHMAEMRALLSGKPEGLLSRLKYFVK
jgi:hypothetical protein